ncbi:hypothetical protein M427DRAFT_183706 [Gonapodya prolifera JEL478]|uniref:Uncharacterized protein n=1 Tax=Gonapodya prolifera (strain JEL478) TaxID=1344416 RepID=A0A139A180_GONPJ|nr:hypothetical protein M427DRAFT_183706 [Gonapodya prolifera JEL478]|eukprot:KXS10285.1 hypothetical protein M427DRAFT_183706 [Gonapodya prolifera JEL478]
MECQICSVHRQLHLGPDILPPKCIEGQTAHVLMRVQWCRKAAGKESCENCVRTIKWKTELRNTVYVWPPSQLAIELAHAVRARMPSRTSGSHARYFRRQRLALEREALARHSGPPPDPQFCFHGPEFLASTPLVGILAKVMVVGPKLSTVVKFDTTVSTHNRPDTHEYERADF